MLSNALTRSRWWIYQRERFPLWSHLPLIAAFSLSAVCVSRLLRGVEGFPPASDATVALALAFLFFLLLRIADEFKDADDDARYRPHRPVPRGLVSLPELGRLGAAALVLQGLLAAWHEPRLLLVLGLAWAYWACMSAEFFATAWLKAHPLAYLLSHMPIVPLIQLSVTAVDWLVPGRGVPPAGLGWFLLMSCAAGVTLEIGRKIRAPSEERHGVQTYSAVWSPLRAVCAWLAALALTAGFAVATAAYLDFLLPVVGLSALLLWAAGATARRYLAEPRPDTARTFELVSGACLLLLYPMLGLAPLLWRLA